MQKCGLLTKCLHLFAPKALHWLLEEAKQGKLGRNVSP